jgi:hypothetical protein
VGLDAFGGGFASFLGFFAVSNNVAHGFGYVFDGDLEEPGGAGTFPFADFAVAEGDFGSRKSHTSNTSNTSNTSEIILHLCPNLRTSFLKI